MRRFLAQLFGRLEEPSETPDKQTSELQRLQVACALTTVQQDLRPGRAPLQPWSPDAAWGGKPSQAAKKRASRLH